tara:strand:+ start:3051 stop:3362 length:312 start_codon:yes stop_codon:yes gene_type:complete
MNLKDKLLNGGGSLYSEYDGGNISNKYYPAGKQSTLHDEYSLNNLPAGNDVTPALYNQVPQFTSPTELAQSQPIATYAGGLDELILDRALDLTGTNTQNRTIG